MIPSVSETLRINGRAEILDDPELRNGFKIKDRSPKTVLRITAEPACAASLAAIMGPLKDRLAGKHVGIIACGSNITLERYATLMQGLEG